MKYVIKCPYCGTTYNVATDESEVTFMCKSCGGQNSIEDAIEKKGELSDEICRKVREAQRQENLKKVLNEELEASQEDVDEEYYHDRIDQLNRAKENKFLVRLIIVCILWFVIECFVIYYN